MVGWEREKRTCASFLLEVKIGANTKQAPATAWNYKANIFNTQEQVIKGTIQNLQKNFLLCSYCGRITNFWHYKKELPSDIRKKCTVFRKEHGFSDKKDYTL